MKLRHSLAVLVVIAGSLTVLLGPAAAQENAKEDKVKVEVHLSAEHAPETIKANTRADLVYVRSSIKTKHKVMYRTIPIAKDVEVVSVKREKKPADPNKAVLVELRVAKEQAAKIEKFKTHVVTVVEREDGKPVTKKRPLTLRLEPARRAKE